MGRCNIDNASPFALFHLRDSRPDAVECRGQVDGENGIPLGRRKCLDGFDMLNPGIVDQDIHLAEHPARFLDHGDDLIGLRHVGG
jgi:hypothetical protein